MIGVLARVDLSNASRQGAVPSGSRHHVPWGVVPCVAVSWFLLVAADVTGARLLDHDALFESGRVGVTELGLFLLGWQLMLVAMMLPASLPAIRAVGRHPVGVGAFWAGFGLVWTVFASVVLSIDSVVHGAVDRLAWLEARPSLLAAGVLVTIGLWQLAPPTSRCLAACRAWAPAPGEDVSVRGRLAEGLRYGQLCVASDAGLMLLMFALGGSAAWMAVIGLAMILERSRWLHGAVHRGIGTLALVLGFAALLGIVP